MGIRRACSYQAVIRTPKAPENYSAMLFTIKQDGEILVSKDISELEIDEKFVYANLTQEETALFVDGICAQMQLRVYASATDAPGSPVWQVPVWPSLDDQILPGGE